MVKRNERNIVARKHSTAHVEIMGLAVGVKGHEHTTPKDASKNQNMNAMIVSTLDVFVVA